MNLKGLVIYTKLSPTEPKQRLKILTVRAHLQGVTGFISLKKEEQTGQLLLGLDTGTTIVKNDDTQHWIFAAYINNFLFLGKRYFLHDLQWPITGRC